MSDAVMPAPIAVPEAQLADLRRRLEAVRWPDRETVEDGSQGPRLGKVRALVEHWRDRYDWRRCEAALNGLGPSRTTIDGLGIHFLHVRSPEPDALPLLLTHGWPGSVLEFREAVGPLTDPASHGGRREDAFHLVIPSLPGFGFSGQPTGTGWGVDRIADAWIALMDRLGYDRWGAQGGDWGAAITTAIGHRAPRGCVGIHLNFVLFRPTPEEVAEANSAERAMLEAMGRYDQVLSGYAKVQATRPQTIGYALADSPVGLAAWIYALFQDVSDGGGEAERAFSLDAMLDDVMLYWLPNAGASSARLYWEAMSSMSGAVAPRPVSVPAGVSMFPGEQLRLSRRWAERRFARLVHFNELPRGGHFAAMEQPALFVDELRATFAGLRA